MMRICASLFLLAVGLFAQSGDIRAMLLKSAEAWNRGDLAAFASDYEDSPETTFIGRDVVRGGPKAIEERYRKRYPDRTAMGTLAFTEIEVRPLAADLAIATGKWTLTRTSGRFSLVLRKGKTGWKIIHDHSS